MDAQTFLANFATVADAPGGVQRVRDLVLDLAVSGRLVEQDPSDEPANTLLERIAANQARLIEEGRAKANRAHVPREPQGPLPTGWSWAHLPSLGFINPRNAVEGDPVVGFVPMPLVPTDIRLSAQFEARRWSEVSKGYTHIANGDVAIAKITPCFQKGKPVVFSGLPSGIGAATTELFVLRPTPGGASPHYLRLFFRSPTFIQGGIPEMTGTAGQQRLPRNYFAGLPVPLPPKAEQERIVTKAAELMELCDELEAQQERRGMTKSLFRRSALNSVTEARGSDELARAWRVAGRGWSALVDQPEDVSDIRGSLLKLAVQGKLTKQAFSDRHADELLEELRSSRQDRLEADANAGNPEARAMLRKVARLKPATPPYALPRGWSSARLIDLCVYLVDCHNKTAPYSETGIPIVRTSNIREGRIVWNGMRYITEETHAKWSRRCPPEPGDIIFTREAPLGEAAIIPPDARFCLGQRTMLIRPWTSLILSKYLLIALREPGLLERSASLTVGSTVQHFRVGDVEGLTVMVPPVEEQSRIVSTVESLTALCDDLEALGTQRQDLLVKLLKTNLVSL